MRIKDAFILTTVSLAVSWAVLESKPAVRDPLAWGELPQVDTIKQDTIKQDKPDNELEVQECFNCNAWVSELDLWESLGTCTWCGSCFDCENVAELCQCGYPNGRVGHTKKLGQDAIPF